MTKEIVIGTFIGIFGLGAAYFFSSAERALDDKEIMDIAGEATSDAAFRKILIKEIIENEDFLALLKKNIIIEGKVGESPDVSDVAEEIKADEKFITMLRDATVLHPKFSEYALKTDVTDLSPYALKSDLHEEQDLSLYVLRSELSGNIGTFESAPLDSTTDDLAPLKIIKNGQPFSMMINDTVALKDHNLVFTVNNLYQRGDRLYVNYTWSNSVTGKEQTSYVYQSKLIMLGESCSITPYLIDVEDSQVSFNSSC